MTDAIESPSILPELISFMQDSMGVNPFTIYCQLTGKPIGRIDQDELEPLLRADMSVEEIADDLLIRLLASMRPSIHWNRMREDSLSTMAKTRPTETLAYLLNRLFQPLDYGKLELAARLDDLHGRIRLFQFICDMPVEERDSLFAMLIEVDAKMNLSQQHIDLRVADFMLFREESMKTIVAWYETCIKRWARSQKLEDDSRRWYKGNTLARPAFLRTWMEAKPESKTEAKKREKREANAEIDSLLMSVLKAAEEAAIPTSEMPEQPAVKPAPSVTRAPAFLFKKKEA